MVEAITTVWSAILAWFVEAMPTVEALFVVKAGSDITGLTLLGTFAIIGVAIGLTFLIIGVIQNFVRLRS